MRALMPLAFLLVAGISSSAHAQVKPEDAIRYRQSVFRVIVWNWMPMNAMSRGRIAFDAAAFAKHAERVAGLATQLHEGFPTGSDAGADTEAKAEIWTQAADFAAKMKTFETESARLAKIAKEGDEAAIKSQFSQVGNACKACHDKYKED